MRGTENDRTNLVGVDNKVLKVCHETLLCEWLHTRNRRSSFRALPGDIEAVAFGLPDVIVFTFEVVANCRRWGGL